MRRCENLHRAEEWPYVRRCRNEAVRSVPVPDDIVVRAWLCDECAAAVEEGQ